MWRYLCISTCAIIISGGELSSSFAAENADVVSIWQRGTLSGDWDGARTALRDKGIELSINSIDEVFGVLSGGVRRRASYEGQTEFTVDTDLAKLIGITGARTHITVLDIRDSGRNVIQNTGSIADPSNIDALPTVRLYGAWFEQTFAGGNSVRLGQILADGEFMTASSSSGLLNGTFGWDDLLGANILNGGPAYPLATPGALLNVKAGDSWRLKTAVFSGNPAGAGCSKQPQECNLYGTKVSVSDGVLWMGELQFFTNEGEKTGALPGTYKLGAWYASAAYNDLHLGLTPSGARVSVGADPSANPIHHTGNVGVYAVADQTVWRDQNRSISFFVRGGLAPSDRNIVPFYVDGGAAFRGMVPGRANDTLSFGVAYAKISSAAAAADRDASPSVVVRDYETVMELAYTAQISPWWTVQPDLQYVVHPNGGQNPSDRTRRLGDALIFGMRSTVKF